MALLKTVPPVPSGAVAAPGVNNLAAQIGHTPLILLARLAPDLPQGVTVYAKAEHLNPGGSVKDRAAWSMICDGISTGRLRPGMTLLDATSGNTGIAYAMIGATLGYGVTLCVPKNTSTERKRIMRAYGAALIETDPLQSSDGAQIRAMALAAPAAAAAVADLAKPTVCASSVVSTSPVSVGAL